MHSPVYYGFVMSICLLVLEANKIALRVMQRRAWNIFNSVADPEGDQTWRITKVSNLGFFFLVNIFISCMNVFSFLAEQPNKYKITV